VREKKGYGKSNDYLSHPINNRAGGNAPLIAEKLAERFHQEKQQRLI